MTDWQDMATAPRDGQDILVWDGYLRFIVNWVADDGWFDHSANRYSTELLKWHPLPEPPDANRVAI